MNRKKFEVRYPQDHKDQSLAGKKFYKDGCFVTMSTDGVFFLVNMSDSYYTSVSKLSNTLPKYDIVWKD